MPQIYHTAAHSDDIGAALLGSDEIEIKTPAGGSRRKASQIHTSDILRSSNNEAFPSLGHA